MNKRLKIFLIIVIVALLCWAVWHFYIRMKQPVAPPTNSGNPEENPELTGTQTNGETPTENPTGKINEDNGETSININKGADYKKGAVNNYFLVYRDFAGGEGQIVEITGSAYLDFMRDYPSGTAKGNVINKYKI